MVNSQDILNNLSPEDIEKYESLNHIIAIEVRAQDIYECCQDNLIKAWANEISLRGRKIEKYLLREGAK